MTRGRAPGSSIALAIVGASALAHGGAGCASLPPRPAVTTTEAPIAAPQAIAAEVAPASAPSRQGPRPELDPRYPGPWGIVRGAPRRIAGVIMAAGAPVRARVSLRGPLTALGAVAPIEVETAADGRFDLGEQPIAPWELVAQRAGHAAPGFALDLATSEPVDDLEVALSPCHRKVFGTVRADGAPIAGAWVYLDSWRAAGAQTDATGAYELCTLDGVVTLWAEAPGRGIERVTPEVEGTMQLDLELPVVAPIEGTVVDADAQPVAGAMVLVLSGYGRGLAPGVLPVFTDARGHFLVDRTAPGEYYVMAQRSPPQGDLAVGHVWAEAPSGVLEIALAPSRHIAGRVEVDGQPLVGATVRHAPDGLLPDAAITRVDGSFDIWNVVTPEDLGYLSIDGYEISIADTARRGPLQITTSNTGMLRGRVMHAGRGVPRAEVCADAGDCIATRTDGRFELPMGTAEGGLVARGRALEAFGRFDRSRASEAQLAIGITIELTDKASVRGVVVDAQGDPVVGAVVTLENASSTDFGSGATGPDGRFYAARMAGGSEPYRVTVFSSADRTQVYPPAKGDAYKTVVIKDNVSQVKNVKLVVSPQPQPAPP